ncbi:MAG: response regulator transcription factor [Deltaproteobacteria bacterium]|nr:response regulator transcription factor [Deltaproteobacteria bacterium]
MPNSAVHPNIVKVLLVEDHAVVREGLVSLIGFLPECSLVGAVGSGAEALSAVRALRPDVLLLDIHLPDMSGLEVLRRLRATHDAPATLVLTSSDSDHTIRQALALGARGYFLKGSGAEALAEALQCVSLGGRYLSPGGQ